MIPVCGCKVKKSRDRGLTGQQSILLRVGQSVTSVPEASEGHRSSLQGGTLFLLCGLIERERGGGRESLSGTLSNSWGGENSKLILR